MPSTSEHPIRRILDGNARWATNPSSVKEEFKWDGLTLDTFGVPPQHPVLLWIGCADSRVPENVIAGGSRPGEIFVHRNVANQIQLHDDNALAVLQYGVEHLNILHVVVVGHTDCGGVATAFDTAYPPRSSHSHSHSHTQSSNPTKPNPIARWLTHLTKLARALPSPLPSQREKALLRLCENNVKAQVTNLAGTEVVRGAWRRYEEGLGGGGVGDGDGGGDGDGERQGAVWVHGWVYDLETRRIRDLRVSRGPRGARCDW